MNDTEYKPNSHKYKKEMAEKKNIEKVIKGVAKTKKKTELRKLADIFIAEDVKDVKSYILMDVLVPAIKNTILDIIVDTAKMVFGGSDRGKRSNASKISYRSFYDKDDRRSSHGESRARSVGYSHDDIVLDSRGEAEDVLSRMDELIETYGDVSVADLYDLVGITGNYTDNNYGWTNIRNAEPVRVRDGYLLKLPKPAPLHK